MLQRFRRGAPGTLIISKYKELRARGNVIPEVLTVLTVLTSELNKLTEQWVLGILTLLGGEYGKH